MLIVTIGGQDYELSAKLKTAMAIEKKFKLPLIQIFGKIESAEIPELAGILALAAGKADDPALREAMLDAWDYNDLQTAVQELLANIMFQGSADEIERKLEKYPASDETKNVLRGLLGIPKKTLPAPTPEAASTGPES